MASGKWPNPFLLKLWALGCSLKLAIALASAATLLIMGGSLVMHYNPAIFTGMEQEIMGRWLPEAWSRAPLAGILGAFERPVRTVVRPEHPVLPDRLAHHGSGSVGEKPVNTWSIRASSC